MHDEKNLGSQLDDLDDEEIEIEFVDVDESPIITEPEPEAEPQPKIPSETVVAIRDESDAQQIAKLTAELDHVRDVYLRKIAEFDNFRKRVERERDDVRLVAVEDFIRELLPVVDNFERALQHADDDSGAFHQGIEMIARQLKETFERMGVAEIDPAGEVFDPELHEAVQRVEDGDHPIGTVVFVMLKGYTLGDRLIRPAMVGVAVESANSGAGDGGES